MKSKKVEFYPLNSTLNDEGLSISDCVEQKTASESTSLTNNKRLVMANKEKIRRDLSEFEKISANTLLLTHNLNFLRDGNNVKFFKYLFNKKYFEIFFKTKVKEYEEKI